MTDPGRRWSRRARGNRATAARTRETPYRRETPAERLDRNFGELLQELRVAQTGVQILFAFLLALAFSPRFADITEAQRNVYVATLLLAAAATGLIIAPVAHHRLLFRRGLKGALVSSASRLALAGLVALMLAMTGSVWLAVDVVLGGGWTGWLSASVLAGFLVLWFAVPAVAVVRDKGRDEWRDQGQGDGAREVSAPEGPPSGSAPPDRR